MILPQKVLDSLSFYEETNLQEYNEYGFHTRFILHFNSWFKRRQVIRIRWHSNVVDRKHVRYTEPQGAIALRAQLEEHFAAVSPCNVIPWTVIDNTKK